METNQTKPIPEPTDELAIGDKLAVAQNLHEPLSIVTKHLREAEEAFKVAAAWHRDQDKHLWAMIGEAHPDICKKYHVAYNHETHQLIIMGKRRGGGKDDE